MNNHQLIEKFYTAFSNGDSEEMAKCYHKDIRFQDPAFGALQGEEAVKMWEMLLSRSAARPKISFSNIQTADNKGTANWKAEYVFGKQKRPVINKVAAQFKFQDGKIIEHIDTFDFWKWSQQALGMPGYLMGWTPFLKKKVQSTTQQQLAQYMSEK